MHLSSGHPTSGTERVATAAPRRPRHRRHRLQNRGAASWFGLARRRRHVAVGGMAPGQSEARSWS